MSKFTAPQLKALKSAVDTGNAWNAWGNVYRTSTNRMMQALCAQGLLTHDGRPTDKTADALGLRIAYGLVKVGASVISAEAETLHECEIPGAPGLVTRGGVVLVPSLEMRDYQLPVVGATKAEHDRGQSFLANSARQLGVNYFEGRDVEMTIVGKQPPPGTYTATLEAAGVTLSGDIITSSIIHGFGSRCIQIVGRCQRIRPHRPKTYKPHALGIDSFKLLTFSRLGSHADLDKVMAQDARVCSIEQELLQYAGKRRTPHRDRKVTKLRKILKTLKRGLYE